MLPPAPCHYSAQAHPPMSDAPHPSEDPRDALFFDYWGQRLDWSDPAAAHWREHFRTRVPESRKMLAHLERFGSVKGKRALDVGCQTGALAVVLAEAGAQVTGIDTEDWLLEAARLRMKGWGHEGSFRVARGEALPFPDASFDVVTFVDVLEHCQDGQQCLREVARVLAPGGLAYVLGPNRFSPEWLPADPHYQLAGASVLSHELGKRYVRWRRGIEGYDVGVFPVASTCLRTLRAAGLEALDSPLHQALPFWRARAPGFLRRFDALGRLWGRVRLDALPTFVLVARRPLEGPLGGAAV